MSYGAGLGINWWILLAMLSIVIAGIVEAGE